jgi:hypothetical protein
MGNSTQHPPTINSRGSMNSTNSSDHIPNPYHITPVAPAQAPQPYYDRENRVDETQDPHILQTFYEESTQNQSHSNNSRKKRYYRSTFK